MDVFVRRFTGSRRKQPFYGPKLDIQVKAALGEWRNSCQLSAGLLLPTFWPRVCRKLTVKNIAQLWFTAGYLNLERFTAILIENYKGAFPTWLAPHPVTLIPVSNEAHIDYAGKWLKSCATKGVRYWCGWRNEKMQYKGSCLTNLARFLISSSLVTKGSRRRPC